MKSVPNMISAFRIILVPVFVLVYFTAGEYARYWAALIFLLAAVSDFLDGYLARKYNSISNLGKILDPVGDKLMTLALAVCLTADGVIPGWIFWFFLVKELVVVVGGLLYRGRMDREVPASNIVGKTATFALFCVGLSIMLFKIPESAATPLMIAMVAISTAALLSYGPMIVKIFKNPSDKKEVR